MRIILAVFIMIHGLAHLPGFLKAFDIYKPGLLSQPISKLYGIIWLMACVFCLVTAVLLVFKSRHWWIAGFIALLVSQTLIILWWQDAKIGTFANLLILLVSISGYSTWKYHEAYKSDIKTAMRETLYYENTALTEADIDHLPEPVSKYIRYCGCIGKPRVHNFKVVLSGRLRKDEKSDWMPFESEQYNFLESPARLFFMHAVMKKLPVAGYHCYKNGKAFMDIRLLSLFRVAYHEGSEMNKAETVTFLNDICCMAPAALIDKRITWETIEKNVIKAIFTNNDITVSALLFFNDMGQLINFQSGDRYNADAGRYMNWQTPLSEYRKINGFCLPVQAKAIYTFPDRDMCYGLFTIQSVTYNIHKP